MTRFTPLRRADPRAEPLDRAEEGTPLYVHLPFCAAKCHYCDFFSVADEGHDIDGMLDAILRESEERAPRAPSTVFLGGGTPSLLSTDQVSRFLDRLDDVTGFRAAAREVTAECNPESLDREKAACLLDRGVRRLSIGFQSLATETLELFGRVHSVDESFHAYEAARAAGARAINVDLIYAAPGQTAESWESDLATVLDLGPDHLSAYNLTFEEGTSFHRWLEEGRLEKTPEEAELAMFETTRRLATERGLVPYEISNYARAGGECTHNVNYWRNGPYVGLGPSAVSKVGQSRAGNARGIAAYRDRIDAAGHATDWSETLEPAGRLAETWWLGLRLADGVDPEEARRTAGFDEESDPALDVARGLEATGHLEHGAGRWRLTPLGLPVADAVAARFLRGMGATDSPGP